MIQAVVFDLDGVLLESEVLWDAAVADIHAVCAEWSARGRAPRRAIRLNPVSSVSRRRWHAILPERPSHRARYHSLSGAPATTSDRSHMPGVGRRPEGT